MKIKKTLEDSLADFEAKKMEIAEWKSAHAPALEAAIKEHESFNLRLAELSMADRRKVLDAAGMKHISAAPTPIEHISGAKINPPTKAELKPINWLHWKHARLALWEACALSLNINPSNMTRHPNEWMAGSESGPIFTDSSFPDMQTQSIFYGRLRLLGENYGNSQYFTDVDNLYAGGANYSAVSPRNFAAWGLDFDFNDMPPELITLAQSRKPEAGLPLILTPQAAPASAPPTLPSVKHKLRTNSLDAPIKRAIKKAESLDTGAVYLVLREMALNCESPFTGEFEGDALCYTKDDNRTAAKLTKDALGKRLKSHVL